MNIIENLLDLQSFVGIGTLIKNADVNCGYGTIEHRLVYVYEQQGFITAAHAKKIAYAYESALKVGAPIIGILNSKGMKIEEGLDCFEAYAQIMNVMNRAKGKIPQLSIITGDCIGTMALIPQLSDFTITVGEPKFYLQSPNTIEKGILVKDQGNIHVRCKDENEVVCKVKELFMHLPSNYLDMKEPCCLDDINREIPGIENSINDIQHLILSVSDNGKFIEIQEGFGNIFTGFCSIGGHTAGVFANMGMLGVSDFRKVKGFANICNNFNIPLLSFTNTSGYNNQGVENERILDEIGEWVKTILKVSVPKINIITKNAVGGSYFLMNSKHLGADIVLAWKDASMGLLEKEGAKSVLNQDTFISINEAGEHGYIDDIIEPAATRKRIIATLEMLYGKRG